MTDDTTNLAMLTAKAAAFDALQAQQRLADAEAQLAAVQAETRPAETHPGVTADVQPQGLSIKDVESMTVDQITERWTEVMAVLATQGGER